MNPLSDEYQTPKKYIVAAREVMGSIDLDPACSSENALRFKEIIKPKTNVEFQSYTKETNGLIQNWFGNIWLNPPYSKPNLTKFTDHLIAQQKYFIQLIYLVPSYTSEKWYHKCLNSCNSICLPSHRINHLINRKFQTSPRFSSTFFYFGNNTTKFTKIFSQFGKCFSN